jgi:pilus assembly protein FimV
MLRKSSLAMAVALALAPVMGLGLGLGDMRSSSGLNQPFDAEIDLVSVKQDEIDQLKVELASPEAFAKAGIERGYHLTKLSFKPVLRPDGRTVVRVSSSEPIREPYLNFLVEVSWAQGRVVREYTVLLDPPAYTGRRGAGVQPPRATGRVVERAATVTQPAGGPVRLSGETYGPVVRGDTLWSIANRVKPAGSSTYQAMSAIVRANPEAFVGGDMNRMLAGSTLSLPVAEDMGAAAAPKRDVGDAAAAAAGRPGAAEAVTRGTGDQLRLAVPTPAAPTYEGPSPSDVQKEALLAQEKAESVRQTTEQLQSRVGELEAQLRDMQRLILLKDAQLAQLQDRAAPPVAAPVPPSPAEPIRGGTWVAPGPQTAPAPTETSPPPAAEPTPVAEPPAPTPAAAPVLPEPPAVAKEPPTTEAASAIAEAKAPEARAPESVPAEPVTAAPVTPSPVAPPPVAEAPRVEEGAKAAEAATVEEAPKVVEAPPAPAAEAPKPAAPVAPPKAEPVRVEPPVTAAAPAAAPPERQPRDVWESVLQDPTTLVGAGVAGVGVLGALIWALASRRRSEEAEEVEPVAAAVVAKAAPVSEPPAREAAATPSSEHAAIVAPVAAPPAPPVAPVQPPLPEPAVPVAAPVVATAAPVRERETDRVSTEDLAALDLSTTDLFGLKDETTEVDPTEEADVYIAYGRFEQAEQLLKLALEMEPNRLALQHKLLEVYFAARDAASFNQLFKDLKAAGKDSIDPSAWQRALRMGRQLDAGNPAYAAAGAAATAVAAGAAAAGADDLSSALAEAQRELAAELERTSTQPPAAGRPDTSTVTPSRMTTESTFDEMDMGSVMNDLSLDLGTQDVPGGALDKTHPFNVDVAEVLKRAGEGLISALGGDTTDAAALGLKEGDTSQLLETELSLATDTDQYQEAMASGPDLANIELNLESPLTGTAEQDTTLVHSDTTLELVDDVETKLDLARAYIELGDKDSARNLLDEVLQEGSDAQKATAQGMLGELA